MFTGLRGLAQSFVRGAVAIGRAIETTYTTLTELGLGYVRSQFDIDWQIYDQQASFVDLAGQMPADQLISGHLHGESLFNLSTKFKYDVRAVYEDLKGNTTTGYWSVASDVRMSQDEILAIGETFAEEYPEEGFPFHAPAEIVGIWHRQAAMGL